MWKQRVCLVCCCAVIHSRPREHSSCGAGVRRDFTRVPLKCRLEGFLNARRTDKASPFRRNVMDKAQADHGVLRN